MERETEGRQIKVEDCISLCLDLWMTKYGAVRVPPGPLRDSSRVWCCQACLADGRVG